MPAYRVVVVHLFPRVAPAARHAARRRFPRSRGRMLGCPVQLPARWPARIEGGAVMRRVVLVLFICAFGWLVAWGVSAGAQEATPTALAIPGPGEFAVAPGQIGRDLAAGQLAALPPTPAFIALSRITSAPGSVFT